MARDDSGNYSLPAGNPVVQGSVVEAEWANTTMIDIGAGLTDSLDRYGRGGMLAPFKFADGTVGAPSMTFTSDPQMGFYRGGVNDMRAAIGGSDKLSITNDTILTAGDVFDSWGGSRMLARGLVDFDTEKSYGMLGDISSLVIGTNGTVSFQCDTLAPGNIPMIIATSNLGYPVITIGSGGSLIIMATGSHETKGTLAFTIYEVAETT